MKISSILDSLSDLLTPAVEAARGTVMIAQDAEEVDAVLEGAGAGVFSVVLVAEGEKIVDPNDADGFVTGQIASYIQGAAGLDILPGANLTAATTSEPDSFLDRISFVIKLIRGADITDPQIDCSLGRIFRFQGWSWYRIADLPAYRAAKAEFEIRYALDDPAAERITDAGDARLTDDGAPRYYES